MKSADNPAATENTTDSMIFNSHPPNTRNPIVTDKMKKMVKIEYKLSKTFSVVAKIATNATAIDIPNRNINNKAQILNFF